MLNTLRRMTLGCAKSNNLREREQVNNHIGLARGMLWSYGRSLLHVDISKAGGQEWQTASSFPSKPVTQYCMLNCCQARPLQVGREGKGEAEKKDFVVSQRPFRILPMTV